MDFRNRRPAWHLGKGSTFVFRSFWNDLVKITVKYRFRFRWLTGTCRWQVGSFRWLNYYSWYTKTVHMGQDIVIKTKVQREFIKGLFLNSRTRIPTHNRSRHTGFRQSTDNSTTRRSRRTNCKNTRRTATRKTDKRYTRNYKKNQVEHSQGASWSAANECCLQRKLVLWLIEDLGRDHRCRGQNRNSRSRNKQTSFRGGGGGSGGLSPGSFMGVLRSPMAGGTTI